MLLGEVFDDCGEPSIRLGSHGGDGCGRGEDCGVLDGHWGRQETGAVSLEKSKPRRCRGRATLGKKGCESSREVLVSPGGVSKHEGVPRERNGRQDVGGPKWVGVLVWEAREEAGYAYLGTTASSLHRNREQQQNEAGVQRQQSRGACEQEKDRRMISHPPPAPQIAMHAPVSFGARLRWADPSSTLQSMAALYRRIRGLSTPHAGPDALSPRPSATKQCWLLAL